MYVFTTDHSHVGEWKEITHIKKSFGNEILNDYKKISAAHEIFQMRIELA